MAELQQELEESDSSYEQQELQGLLLQDNASATTNNAAGASRPRKSAALRISLSLVVLLSLLLCWYSWWIPGEVSRQKETEHGNVLFTCPPTEPLPNKNTTTLINGDDKKSYDRISQEILANATAYFQSFRESQYDDWRVTYQEMKDGMYEWKRRHFDLTDNESIYESACGIGLNLYMTLEILAEVRNLQNISVYGNEYVSESVEVANLFLDQQVLPWPGNARRGAICNGDSTSLDYVPSNSFDLVFTGYITPLLDPLELDQSTDEVYNRLTELCSTKGSDPESNRLVERIQELQETWYAQWVSEMVRIAKPGAPVIVEQVSYPLCDSLSDWGGVSHNFWKHAVVNEWDVDPETLDIVRDHVFEGMFDRYHVFMRKNGRHPS